jgi:hypothetical protein
MFQVEEFVFDGPGLDSIPAISSKTAKNTFLQDLAYMGAKKYFVRLCLKHNKACGVSYRLAHGLTVQCNKLGIQLAIIGLTLPTKQSFTPQRSAARVQLTLHAPSPPDTESVRGVPSDSTTSNTTNIPYKAAMTMCRQHNGMTMPVRKLAIKPNKRSVKSQKTAAKYCNIR